MGHSPKCMPIAGDVDTIISPKFGTQKVVPGPSNLTSSGQAFKRNDVVCVSVLRPKQPPIASGPAVLCEVELVHAVGGVAPANLRYGVGQRPVTRILVPDDGVDVLISCATEVAIWLEDPHTLEPEE